MDADESDKRRRIASALEDLVGNLKPEESSQVELEKLKAGLSLVLEEQKSKIAEAAEGGHTWLDIIKGVTPLAVTSIVGLVGTIVTLHWQQREHDTDALTQQKAAAVASEQAVAAASSASAAASAAADRQGQELQAAEEAKARQDRSDLLQRLAQAVAAGPPPSPSCWYARGIWHDYSRDEPLPEVLAARCPPSPGQAVDAGTASPGAQWVIVLGSDVHDAAPCAAADRARRDGLNEVQVLWEQPPGIFVTTAGQYSTRPDAIGYLQRVRSVRADAYIARQYSPQWTWHPCRRDGGA